MFLDYYYNECLIHGNVRNSILSISLGGATLVGIGYLVTNTVNIAINPNIPKPMLYGAVSGTFHLVGIFIVCTILYAMK